MERPPSDAPPIASVAWMIHEQIPALSINLGEPMAMLLTRLVIRYWPRRAIERAERDGEWSRVAVERILFARVREEVEARRGLAAWGKVEKMGTKAIFRLLLSRWWEDPMFGVVLGAISEDMARHGVEPL